ncbi:MAG TPA: hypothetical protein VJC39_00840 [Candidatus Nanoarchaeia archaeon]|nr:hypothetical protein [Candidatus Nanoarchaeia archaeon]
MVNIKYLILLSILAVFVTACVPLDPASEQHTVIVAEEDGPGTKVTATPLSDLPEEIVNLIAQNLDIVNYRYSYQQQIVGASGNLMQEDYYEVFIKNNKVLKKYLQAVKLGGDTFYNKVFLDSDLQTAIAVCDSSTTLCEDLKDKKYIQLEYADEALGITPKDLPSTVSSETKKIGTTVIDNRKNSIFEYMLDGKLVKMYIDESSGLTMRVEFYRLENEDKILERRLNYSKLSINSVLSSEVNLPEGYTLKN